MPKGRFEGWTAVRVIGATRALSTLGDELAIFALLLREKHHGGGALSIAVILAAGHLPLILLSPLAGAVADRVPVRRLAPVASILQALFAALLAFNSSLYISLALIVLIGAGQAFTSPAWAATLPELVGKDSLPRAMSLLQALFALAGLAGPGVAGIMVARFGYVTPMVTNAGTFVMLAAVPAFLTLPFQARVTGPRQRREVWAGLQAIRREPVIRATTLLMFSLILVLNAFNVASLFFAIDTLHASQLIFGLAASTFAGGGLVAAIVNERREVNQSRLPANIVVGSLMCGGGVFLTGLAWHWVSLFPTVFLAGAGGSTISAYGMALVVQRSPDESRARVISSVQAMFSVATLGALGIAGVIVPLVGPRSAILISGGASLLVVVALSPTLIRSVNRNLARETSETPLVMDLPLPETE